MAYKFGDFVFDVAAYELRRADEVVKVDPKVLDLLAYLLRRSGQLVTRQEIIDAVWEGRALSESVLSGAMWSLRKALGASGKAEYIATVYGKGYRFTAPVESRHPAAQVADPPVPVAVDRQLVGRDGELARALSHLSALRSAHGGLVAISGEAGIGKTRLTEALTERCQGEGITVSWSHCRAGALSPPFWPFLQFLRSAANGHAGLSVMPQVRDLLAELLPSRETAHSTHAVTEQGVHSLLDRFQQALLALSTTLGPAVLVIDDAQWADGASQRLLTYLLPELSHLPLLIVLTVRTDDPSGAWPSAVMGHRNVDHIQLVRLSEAAVSEYVRLAFGTTDADLPAAVFTRSEGNPFFMVELLRPFQQGTQPPSAGRLALPGPALDIVRARLSLLGAETRRCLDAAAVLGRGFDLGLLATTSGMPPSACMAALDEAQQAALVRSLNTQEGGGYEFGHELIRSALLEGLSSERRAVIHHRAALAIEARHPVGAGVPGPDLVDHWLSAVPQVPAEKPVEYALRLSGRFTQLPAHTDAVAVLEKAVGALNADPAAHPRLRCVVLLALASAERLCARPSFMHHFGTAVALAKEHAFADLLSQAGRRLSMSPGFIFHRDTHDILEAAAVLLPEDATSDRAQVLAHLSWTPPSNYDAARAHDLVEQAEALAQRSGDTVAKATALCARLHLASGPDDPAAGTAVARQIGGLLAGQHPLVQAAFAAQVAFTSMVNALQRGDLRAAHEAFGDYERAARSLKHMELQWHVERARLALRLVAGERQGLQAAYADLYQRGRRADLFSLTAVRATDSWALESQIAPDMVSDGERMPTPAAYDAPLRKAYKVRWIAEGSPEAGGEALEVHFPLARLHALPHDRDYLGTLAHLCQAALTSRSSHYFRPLLELLQPFATLFASDITLYVEGAVNHYLGLLHEGLGERTRALSALERAVESSERAGYRTCQVHSGYELGRVLLAGQGEEALRGCGLIEALAPQAEALGMERLLTRIKALSRNS